MKLNIVSGGYAIPLGNNFFLMQGNKHNKGEKRTPTDLTYYNKGGGIKQGDKLEVEGGEIEQKLPGELRVFSAQPMINGESPASLVMQGANPDKVFSIQQSLNGNHKGKTAERGSFISWIKGLFGNEDSQEEKKNKGVNYDFSNLVPTREQIINTAWQNENPNNEGLNKNGTYSKYLDPNGKGYDVGPGLLVGSAIEDKDFYTKEELDEAAYQYGLTGLNNIGKDYNELYGTDSFTNPFDTVSVAPKLLMLDTRYQNGTLPAKKWPSLYKAISEGNWGEALRQSRSTFTRNGVKYYDNDRVRRRADSLFKGMFNVLFKDSTDSNLPTVTRIKEKFGGEIKTNKNMSKNNFKLADVTSGLVHHSTGEQKQFKCGGRKKMAQGDDIIDNLLIDYENEPTITANYPSGLIAPIKGFDVASPAYPEIKVNIPNTIRPIRNNKVKNSSSILSDPESFWSSIASVGSNALSAGLGWLTNKITLNRLADSFRKAPAPIIAPKLKTQYNIEPQLADIRSMLARSEEDINANTASSRVGLARKQRLRTATNAEINKLYGQKENVETQLINADRMQQYEAAKLNAQRYDDWREKENTFQLGLLDKRGENTMSLINNLNRGFQDIVGNMRQQRNFRNTLAAQLMTNPDAAKLFTDKDNKSLIKYINNLFK